MAQAAHTQPTFPVAACAAGPCVSLTLQNCSLRFDCSGWDGMHFPGQVFCVFFLSACSYLSLRSGSSELDCALGHPARPHFQTLPLVPFPVATETCGSSIRPCAFLLNGSPVSGIGFGG